MVASSCQKFLIPFGKVLLADVTYRSFFTMILNVALRCSRLPVAFGINSGLISVGRWVGLICVVNDFMFYTMTHICQYRLGSLLSAISQSWKHVLYYFRSHCKDSCSVVFNERSHNYSQNRMDGTRMRCRKLGFESSRRWATEPVEADAWERDW